MSYVTPETVLAIGVTFVFTSITAVGARFATRLHSRNIGTDDWLSFGAFVLVLGACAIMIAGYATHSLGTHTPPVGKAVVGLIDPTYQLIKKLQFALYCLLVPALLCMKLSTLFFYRRIFRGKAFQISFWILATFSVLWAVSFFFAFAAACPNVENEFKSVLSLKKYCVDTFVLLICQCIFDVVVDLGILILPMYFVYSLQMPLRRKIGVTITLLVGASAIGCGITRMAIFAEALGIKLLSQPTVAGLRTDDARGLVSAFCIWSMLELGVGMVAICLPTLRPLLKKRSLESVARNFRDYISLGSSRNGSESKSRYSRSQNSSRTEQHFYGNGCSTKITAGLDSSACDSLHDSEATELEHSKDQILVLKTVKLESVSSV